MMSTRSGRIRQSITEASPPRTRKGVSPTRSPARKRKSSPTVRSSQKSPSRKSPSRKPAPKYPARKSPSRAVKEIKETKEVKEIPKSPSKRPTIKKEVQVKLDDVSSKIELLRSTRKQRLEYSVADFATRSDSPRIDFILNEELNGIKNLETAESLNDIYSVRSRRTVDETDYRRSSRLQEIVNPMSDIRHSFSKSPSKSVSKSVSQSIGAYSDEEDIDELLHKYKSKSQSVTRKLATPLPSNSSSSNISNRFEFGGRLGATVLYVLIPLTVLYVLISCSKACTFISFNELSVYKTIPVWFNVQTAAFVLSNILLQAVFLSISIFGTKGVDERGRKYYFNAFFSCLSTLNILFALNHYNVLKINILLQSYLQMATVSYLTAVFLALIMFLKSYKTDKSDLNPYGNSGYVLYDFFIGREIQAVFMNINVKLWLARVSNISTLIFSILILKHGFTLQEWKGIGNFSLDELKSILNKVHFKPTILLYTTMQIIYALYFIAKEKKIMSTFYWHSEGLGYLQIVSSALYPYYFTTISKYVADTDLQLDTYVLIAASTLFLLGFLIMLVSNNIKFEFRKDPLQPSLMYLDSMPTFHGKKLLVSNLWGIIRHPNYTGDILIHTALAFPGIFSRQMIAAAPALLTIVMLLHRCWRDHDRCKRRYGAAWQRYCKRVPSVIIPKIL